MAGTTATTTTTAPDPHGYLRRQTRWGPFEIAFWLATLLPFWLFPTYLALASQIAITALFAVSLDLILGYAGIISLGHAVYFGLGAYTAGLISVAGWGEPVTAMVAGAAVAGVFGYLTSFIVVRVQNLALIMVTLGLGFLAVEAANSMGWLTGGADGLRGIETGKLLWLFKFDFYGNTAYAYALGTLFLTFLVARRLVHSPFGLSLRGNRENLLRMPAIGSPSRSRLRQVYTIAAVMAGVAGAVLAQTVEYVSLEALGFQRSADVAIILLLGGTGRLYGAILGAIIFLLARDQLADVNPQYWYFWIGLLLMAVVMFMPQGILGGLTRLVPARWRSP